MGALDVAEALEPGVIRRGSVTEVWLHATVTVVLPYLHRTGAVAVVNQGRRTRPDEDHQVERTGTSCEGCANSFRSALSQLQGVVH